ncbi:MAG: MerR family transcriptional regulator [Chloroflexota bacterium]|nr:MAG: MerR family transcriptional regulator [Chloroflexota bacterium]
MSFLTSGDVRRLTGASARMLDHWHWIGLVVPGGDEEPRRQYTLHDVVKIRALLALRKQGVSLRTIRRCLSILDERQQDLASVRLIVIDRDVFVAQSDQDVERIRDGQLAMTLLSCDALLAAPTDRPKPVTRSIGARHRTDAAARRKPVADDGAAEPRPEPESTEQGVLV